MKIVQKKEIHVIKSISPSRGKGVHVQESISPLDRVDRMTPEEAIGKGFKTASNEIIDEQLKEFALEIHIVYAGPNNTQMVKVARR